MIRRIELPVLGGITAVVVDIVAFGGTMLVELLASGELISILSIATGVLAPRLQWLDEQLLSAAILVTGLLYLGITISRAFLEVHDD